MKHGLLGGGAQSLPVDLVLFLILAVKLYDWSRRLGY